MPGFFGVSRGPRDLVEALRREFEASDGQVRVTEVGGAWIGSTDDEAQVDGAGDLTVIDNGCGEFRRECGPLESRISAQADGSIEIRTDASGVLPLYYSTSPTRLVFSGKLRPLARATGAEVDRVGVAEFVRFAYTTEGRTLFKGVHRLLPGQRLRWARGDGATVSEGSEIWVGLREDLSDPEAAAEEALPLVRRAMRASLPESGQTILMMSAGWDSRTLLALGSDVAGDGRLKAFSHGDLESRELDLARRLAERAGVPWSARGISHDVWDLDHLEEAFRRTETLIFPHWTWAARANEEASCILSGVLGEVLGGHYGPTQTAHGARKGLALLRGMASPPEVDHSDPVGPVFQEFALQRLGKRWYLRDEVEGGAAGRAEILSRTNIGIRRDLERLRGRGIATKDQLREAFVTEHRGVQYISAQALAARLQPGMALPFAHPDLLAFASRIPAGVKIHNRVSRALGKRLAGNLNRLPLAATLVPAAWPMIAQEASRVVRRGYEELRRAAAAHSKGWLEPARLGWVNFGFLAEGDTVRHVVDSLRSEIWDREGIDAHVDHVLRQGSVRSNHPFFDQMGKILTVDRMIG